MSGPSCLFISLANQPLAPGHWRLSTPALNGAPDLEMASYTSGRWFGMALKIILLGYPDILPWSHKTLSSLHSNWNPPPSPHYQAFFSQVFSQVFNLSLEVLPGRKSRRHPHKIKFRINTNKDLSVWSKLRRIHSDSLVIYQRYYLWI